jgi:hypothetical protein
MEWTHQTRRIYVVPCDATRHFYLVIFHHMSNWFNLDDFMIIVYFTCKDLWKVLKVSVSLLISSYPRLLLDLNFKLH